ncbi:UDP-glucosyltransferase 2-like [Sitodiplosis mosellana]|uniref:UDP-glucosyltransferase 2-like n=1 Tax=Sitodiplosis mosellana TaxID=263140 RepID=UPI0024439565|nr:UDP-glucosyltransferase 2-like [Sitodiplosis mosellana]XP_055297525.1 UDP-glucosyltransferase 2-like [Sitodiplosis mosellana]XP_055297526.1 UDP-glucosyltransferase 2-like [Sitodiplosis mosellana]
MYLTWRNLKVGSIFANVTISSQNLQNFLKTKQHFDAVIVEICSSDYLIGFGQYFNAPVIGLSPYGATKWTNDLVGIQNFPSYVPNVHSQFTDRMNFWQRMYNSVSFWFEEIVAHYDYIPDQQKVMETLFPEAKNWPSLFELRKNVSLVLLNTHTTIGSPRPYAPNIIEVGGMQIKKEVNPLPPKIQKFLDEAKDGVIFVSFGSYILLSMLPKPQLDAIVGALGLYPNHRILIKDHGNVIIPSHNKNDVLIESWVDQQSILAHENTKLFVTHGGILSTTEAIYFGKPMVGISTLFDQHLNMFLAEQHGFAINVPIQSLTAGNIATAFTKVLSDPSYAEQAKITSDRFRDQPLTPLKTAIHWVKHVAKNKGAPHLKSVAVELPFYKLYNLDVWAFIFSVLALVIYCVIKLIRTIVSFFFKLFSQPKLKNA